MAEDHIGIFRDSRKNPCPFCGHLLDSAMAADSKNPEATPKAGDFSVCLSCASILVIDENLKPQKPAPGYVKAVFDAEPAFAKAMRRAQRFVRGLDRRMRGLDRRIKPH